MIYIYAILAGIALVSMIIMIVDMIAFSKVIEKLLTKGIKMDIKELDQIKNNPHNKYYSAVKTLEHLKYIHKGGALWRPPLGGRDPRPLLDRIDKLEIEKIELNKNLRNQAGRIKDHIAGARLLVNKIDKLESKKNRATKLIAKLKRQLTSSQRRHRKASDIINTIQDDRFLVAYKALSELPEDPTVVSAKKRHNAGETYIILTIK